MRAGLNSLKFKPRVIYQALVGIALIYPPPALISESSRILNAGCDSNLQGSLALVSFNPGNTFVNIPFTKPSAVILFELTISLLQGSSLVHNANRKNKIIHEKCKVFKFWKYFENYTSQKNANIHKNSVWKINHSEISTWSILLMKNRWRQFNCVKKASLWRKKVYIK